jgi:DNA replication initiation complex subunit (GINS family)
METEMQTETIFAKLIEEKKTGELQPLPRNFYANIEADNKKPKNANTQELQNKQSTLGALKSRRMQKILVYLAYNKPLPTPLPAEEEDIYYQILKIINKEEQQVKTTTIKINIKIPEIITPNGSKIGPYQEGDTIQIANTSDVEFIINNKIGEITS